MLKRKLGSRLWGLQVEATVSGSCLLEWALALWTLSLRLLARLTCSKKRLLPSPFLSVRMEQLASRWTYFRIKVSLLLKSVDNIQVWLKPDRNIRHFTCRLQDIYDAISMNHLRYEKKKRIGYTANSDTPVSLCTKQAVFPWWSGHWIFIRWISYFKELKQIRTDNNCEDIHTQTL